MKKLGKILLVMAMTLTVFFAMMTVANAATISSVSAGVAADEGRTISVTVEYGSPEAAQQSTVLVVKQGTALATLEDSDIKYIDQEAVSDTAVTYTFKLLEADRTGAYDVYVGGTGVDAPGSTSFSFDTKKIVGTIKLVDGATEVAYAGATAVATDAAGNSVNGKVASDGAYVIEVGQGTYDVVLGKAGYLYKTYENKVIDQTEVDLGTITLIPGDYNGDKQVTVTDIAAAKNFFDKDASTVEDFALDINGDGKVTVIEIQAALVNFDTKGYVD
ncbi:MAG: dockerin type I domain-containing protein [Clostridia bacterium]